jgi:hypothetical protein
MLKYYETYTESCATEHDSIIVGSNQGISGTTGNNLRNNKL